MSMQLELNYGLWREKASIQSHWVIVDWTWYDTQWITYYKPNRACARQSVASSTRELHHLTTPPKTTSVSILSLFWQDNLPQPWGTYSPPWSPPLRIVWHRNNPVSRIDIQDAWHVPIYRNWHSKLLPIQLNEVVVVLGGGYRDYSWYWKGTLFQRHRHSSPSLSVDQGEGHFGILCSWFTASLRQGSAVTWRLWNAFLAQPAFVMHHTINVGETLGDFHVLTTSRLGRELQSVYSRTWNASRTSTMTIRFYMYETTLGVGDQGEAQVAHKWSKLTDPSRIAKNGTGNCFWGLLGRTTLREEGGLVNPRAPRRLLPVWTIYSVHTSLKWALSCRQPAAAQGVSDFVDNVC